MAVTHHFALAAALFLMASSFHIPMQRGRRASVEHHGRSLEVVNQTEITATDTDDKYYYAVVGVGTPAQPVKLLLDTSHAWTWIPSADCGNPCATSGTFDPELSSTFVATPTYRQLDYQNGITLGYVVSDSVSIGNETSGAIVTPSMQFLLVDYIWGNVDAPFDGTFGLAFGTYLGGASTFLDTLYANGLIGRRIFSLYFDGVGYSGTEDNSAFTIGTYDLAAYSDEDVIFLPVYKAIGLWSLQLSALHIGSWKIALLQDVAIINSTSYDIAMPPTDAQQVYAAISDRGDCAMDPVSGRLRCDCGMAYSIDSYPDIVMTLGTRKTFRLKSRQYFYQELDGCYALIRSDETQWVLGTPFLRAYYTIYDMDNELIGIAASLDGSKAFALAVAGALMLLWSA